MSEVCENCGYCVLCGIHYQLKRIANALHDKEDEE